MSKRVAMFVFIFVGAVALDAIGGAIGLKIYHTMALLAKDNQSLIYSPLTEDSAREGIVAQALLFFTACMPLLFGNHSHLTHWKKGVATICFYLSVSVALACMVLLNQIMIFTLFPRWLYVPWFLMGFLMGGLLCFVHGLLIATYLVITAFPYRGAPAASYSGDLFYALDDDLENFVLN